MVYECYLDGVFYGSGDLNYMKELFVDYVITCQMYGKEQCEFKIIKKDKNVCDKCYGAGIRHNGYFSYPCNCTLKQN